MYAAAIVETRYLSDIRSVIEAHMSKLDGFELIIYHGLNNASLFTEIDCEKKIVDIKTLNDYNLLLTSFNFWSGLLKYDKVLIFQHDSGILKDNISDFLEWDYIGAPWYFQDDGGNGGFSLRNPKVMTDIIRGMVYNPGKWNEDLYFCEAMRNYNMRLAPKNVCEQFSVETVFKLGTFGYHLGSDAERILSSDEINKIRCQSTMQI